jgi:hypothetical protein
MQNPAIQTHSPEPEMSFPIRTCCAALLAAATCLPAAAQSLKPGLWEISNKMDNPQVNEAMKQMQQQLAQMPPEQRKQMEAMMAQRGMKMGDGSGAGTTMQICMTKEMAERGDMQMDQGNAGCKITSQSRSGNTMKMAYACTNPPSSGEGEYTYKGSEGYSSKMKVTTMQSGKPETMTMEGSGKWLSADCGNIKPMVPPKK